MRKQSTLQEKLQKLNQQREQYKTKLHKVEAKIADVERKIREQEEREVLALLRNSRLSVSEIREMLSQREMIQTAQAPQIVGASDAIDIVDQRNT